MYTYDLRMEHVSSGTHLALKEAGSQTSRTLELPNLYIRVKAPKELGALRNRLKTPQR